MKVVRNIVAAIVLVAGGFAAGQTFAVEDECQLFVPRLETVIREDNPLAGPAPYDWSVDTFKECVRINTTVISEDAASVQHLADYLKGES